MPPAERPRTWRQEVPDYVAERLEAAWPDVAELVSARLEIDPPAWREVTLEKLRKRRAPDDEKVKERHTLRLTLRGAPAVVVKLVPDERGLHAHAVQRWLWEHGFGADAEHRVVEPLGYLERHRLALMREVGGRSLSDMLEAGERDAALDGARRAAQWLARLHAAPLAMGPPLLPEHQALDLARAAAKLVSSTPAAEPTVSATIDELESRLPAEPSPPAQCHLDYRPDHVLLDGDGVTVLDFNGSAPADPAWDLGRFVMKAAIRAGRSEVATAALADDVANAFLAEYGRGHPRGLAGLAYAWSYLVARQLFRAVRRGRSDDVERWTRELAGVPDRLPRLDGP